LGKIFYIVLKDKEGYKYKNGGLTVAPINPPKTQILPSLGSKKGASFVYITPSKLPCQGSHATRGGKMKFADKLRKLEACEDAIEWVGDKSFKEAWNTCERADWMLWYIAKAELGTKRERIHIVCDCAETSLKYVPEGEDGPRLAIEAARAYADNPTKTNLKKLIAAESAAWYAANAAWSAAEYAATAAGSAAEYAAGYAAWYTARPAANAAWSAARYAVWSAAGYAANAARYTALKTMADMIRKKFNLKELK